GPPSPAPASPPPGPTSSPPSGSARGPPMKLFFVTYGAGPGSPLRPTTYAAAAPARQGRNGHRSRRVVWYLVSGTISSVAQLILLNGQVETSPLTTGITSRTSSHAT